MFRSAQAFAVSAALCVGAVELGRPTPVSAATTVGTIAGLRALPVPASQVTVTVAGYWAPGDGGGGTFRFVVGSQLPDNKGTIIAPVPLRPGRWVRNETTDATVKWFGARGDNRTNDTAAIQAAVNYLPAGRLLRFPPAVYRIDASVGINLKSYVRLDLTGATVVGANVNGAKCQLFLIRKQRNVTITGGTLVGSRVGTPAYAFGIFADDSTDLIFEKMTLRDFWWDGMILTGNVGCQRVWVRNVTVTNSRRTGIAIIHASYVTIEASTFSGTHGQDPEAGLNVEPNAGEMATNVRIIRCTMNGNAGTGVWLHRSASVSVTETVVSNNKYGITASGVNGATVVQNRVIGNRFGITLGPTTTRASVATNWLQSNFRGIFSSGATGVDIRGNTVIGTGPSTVTNGGSGGDGIVCTGGSSTVALPNTCVIANNIVRRMAGNGIVAWGIASAKIWTNTVDETGARGVQLRATLSSDVRGNSIAGTGEESPPQRYDGVEIEEASRANTVVANVIHRSFGMRLPIGISSDSTGNSVQQNSIVP
jgi:nitrous oxidase accessory protein NosD